jgi:hypothetical protein
MQVLQILRLTGVKEIEIKGRHARLSFLLQIGGGIEGATRVWRRGERNITATMPLQRTGARTSVLAA